MEIACLLIPFFPLQVEGLRDPKLEGRPFTVPEARPRRQAVTDTSKEACGVTSDMRLPYPLARHGKAKGVAVGLDCEEDWRQVLIRLENCSPAVEDGGAGCAYVDIDGLACLYREEDIVARALMATVPAGWGARLGMAQSKFPAYAAACVSGSGLWAKVPEDTAGYLAPFPVDILPLSQRTIERFRSFGLKTLGQIAGLPLGTLQAQFGREEGGLAWGLAQGIDRRPLVPLRRQVVVKEAVSFPSPVVSNEALLMAVENLLARAFRREELQGRWARVARLQFEIAGAPAFVKRVTFKEPVAGRKRAYSVFKNLMADLRMPGPVEAISLTLSHIGGEAGRQASLFKDVRQRDNLRQAISELQARFGGSSPIYQVRDLEPWSRIPERRRALVPYGP
ncbi:MAG: hypothetical protein HY664_03645 [Chloroflexi bacterium]|nr:hypothetical protein [Chloroflexota bacterium]